MSGDTACLGWQRRDRAGVLAGSFQRLRIGSRPLHKRSRVVSRKAGIAQAKSTGSPSSQASPMTCKSDDSVAFRTQSDLGPLVSRPNWKMFTGQPLVVGTEVSRVS